jgi:peptide/nickel transport system ATP-binding protein
MSSLAVRELAVGFGDLTVVNRVSFEIPRGRKIGLVGESGSGKSLTALAIAGLLPAGAWSAGVVEFEGVNLLTLNEREMARRRGRLVASVFQDPLRALNPVMRVGEQIAEAFRLHGKWARREAANAAIESLRRVGIPDVERKARSYPHELSGGQRQRVMVAIAMAQNPALLIADEPTTALDVTIQAEILHLMAEVVATHSTALLFISHDLPVVAGLCDWVAVMYGGRIVESGPTGSVFSNPKHRYTEGLLRAQPSSAQAGDTGRLPVIPGVVPPAGEFPIGCAFRERCSSASTSCVSLPDVVGDEHRYACWHPIGGDAS